ncbi:hypothetical protein CCP4SC76_1100009 [Gammaproteobacteria bacterium]
MLNLGRCALWLMLVIAYVDFTPVILAGGLNDTGITTCSDATQNGLLCPVTGFPGQDAEFGTNGFNFTKLDANGNALTAAITDPICIRDNVTGLTWEVKTNDGGLRDQKWSYTWFDASAPGGNPGTASGGSCQTTGRCDIEKYVQDVNTVGLCGLRDWRLPTVKELAGIIDYSRFDPNPTIDVSNFPNTPASPFWSSTPYANASDSAWNVNFGHGFVNGNARANAYAIRLVSGGPLTDSLMDHGNGTVTQNATGLMWAQCSEGQSGTGCTTGHETYMPWDQALTAAKNSRLGGYSDWRLPNAKELQSLVDYSRYSPSIDIGYFPNTPASYFWSSSPSAYYPQFSWPVYFFDGPVSGGYGRSGGLAVRLVRGSQSAATFNLLVSKSGTGVGLVTSDPPGIHCGSSCTASYTSASSVTLKATPDQGYRFAGWSGDCSGNSSCTMSMMANRYVTATFIQPSLTWTATAQVNGSGGTISPPSQTVAANATATFAITPNSGYDIASATGCNGGLSGNTYTTGPMVENCTVTVSFTPNTVNGVCGPDHGKTLTSPPTQLCTTGTPSLVYGTGPWTWTCGGTNGGTSANCQTNASSYRVTATASTGGSISPDSRDVVSGGVTSFTVTPASGYRIDVVTGCNGSLNGTLYATGSITGNCQVSASFVATNTTTTITQVTPSPSKVGEAVTVSYSVAHPGAGNDSVTVSDSSGTSCQGTVTAGSCTLTFNSAGPRILVASYVPSGIAQASASAGFSHLVASTPTLTTPSLPNNLLGVPYALLLVAEGGVPPYSFRATGLATGIDISSTGLLSGTAVAVGAYLITVTATDALNQQSAPRDYTLTILAQLRLATTSLPDGLVNQTYVQSLQAVGGQTPYTWGLASGHLPGGLRLNTATGELSGTPTDLGTSASFTVQVQDIRGQTATQALNFTTRSPDTTKINSTGTTQVSANLTPAHTDPHCTLDDHQTLVINLGEAGAPTTAPPNSTLPYDGIFKIAVQGCTPGQTQRITLVYPEALPPGTRYWKYGKTTDNKTDHWYVMPGAVIQGNSVTFSITDGGSGDDDLTADGVLTDPGAPAKSNLAVQGSPTNGRIGTPYSVSLTGVNGSGSYTLSIPHGSLPNGLTLSHASHGLPQGMAAPTATVATLSGTPTESGTFDFTVQVVDTGNADDITTQIFSIVVSGGSANDTVTLQANSPSIVGAGVGDDTYVLGPNALSSTANLTLSDTQGSNRLQLLAGLSIAKSEVATTSLRLTLSNGAKITVLGANAFQYDAGGTSTPVDYATFALNTLKVTVPTTTGIVATGGSVTIP